MNQHPRTILIGTAGTLGSLAKQLAAHDHELGRAWLGAIQIGSGEIAGAESITPKLTVLGDLRTLVEVCETSDVDRAIVSLPGSMESERRVISGLLKAADVVQRFVPPLGELLSHEPAPAHAGDGLCFDDLLGRPVRKPDEPTIRAMIQGKRVLITGAGGSIGSELARIVASHEPESIMLMERSENALFEIDRQIASRWPSVKRHAALHDVTDEDETSRIVRGFGPSLVLHAAAHKHVPLMEDHPAHAVENNFFGTKSIVDAAIEAGADRFVLISSDKAVRPSSVMGATKRLAERYVLGSARPGGTVMSAVRFGNVIGSACSVLPIWSAQIAEGGPLTITDERMTRYFMTIPEAAGLVLQAGAMADHHAQIFVLDMGEPIEILGLAERFVRAKGFAPRLVRPGGAAPTPRLPHEIDLILIGARQGEKLHEELRYADERLSRTGHASISALSEQAKPSDEQLAGMVAGLHDARRSINNAEVLGAIRAHLGEPDALDVVIPAVRAGTIGGISRAA